MRQRYFQIFLLTSLFFSNRLLAQAIDTAKHDKVVESESGNIVLANNNLSRAGSVLAPFRYGDKVYFTATVPKKFGTGTVNRLFSAIRNEPASLQLINPKEEDLNAANATLNLGGDRIYYTVYKDTRPGKEPQSEIWYRHKQYDGTWGQIVQCPKHINQTGVITTQPTCGYDAFLRKEVLCFSSNRPGGKGGLDIWCSTVERDGTFGIPFNLPFNTASDEVTPFIYTESKMLLFSSNMPGGKGGFDIYRTEEIAAGAWQPIENLGVANTEFDELYFSFHQPTQTSYFCSNRPNKNCLNNPKGCPDYAIFTGKLGGSLYVNTMSQFDSSALYGCNIELENTETGVIEITILRSESSTVELPVRNDKKYRLIVSRPGYFPIFLSLENVYSDFAHPARKTVYLRPMK